MNSFITRVISALVAVAIVACLYIFLNITGLKILVCIAPVIGGLEAIPLLFKKDDPKFLKILFYLLSLLLFANHSLNSFFTTYVFVLICLILAIAVLIFHRLFTDIQAARNFIANAMMGFLYVGLLPAFALKLLTVDQKGLLWFLFLLAVVFAGDILAYVFGVLFGKIKIMPLISPKKSLQGSIGGLVGSGLAAVLMHVWLTDYNLASLLLLAIIAGMTAQLGDFFESLLKRVANIKDSGKIMPGHGGVLDRIDGVLFAAPIIYLGALILEKTLSF